MCLGDSDSADPATVRRDSGQVTAVVGAAAEVTGEAEVAQVVRGTAVGRYMIIDLIGRGGMGVVYKAFDPELSRLVALKLLSIRRAAEQTPHWCAVQKARLLREAKALAQLSHPNIVTVHDVGTHGESVFMAMEYVEGKTLDHYLDSGRCSREELLEILAAAGRGLAAAHRIGIIHRDFKPSNVIIGCDGRVRVIDFGLARGATGEAVSGERSTPPATAPAGDLLGPTQIREPDKGALEGAISTVSIGNMLKPLTREGSVIGTPHYMAPEQHLARGADEKSDQFAFCVVLFEALHGARPFTGQTIKEVARKISLGEIERPAGSQVPTWLDRIAARGLTVDPAERFGSMGELLASLADDPAIERIRLRERWLKRGLGVLLLLFAGLAAWGVWYGRTREARLCQGGVEKLIGVWDDQIRRKVNHTFVMTGRPYAQDTFERVAKILDRYTGDWISSNRAACEATHVRGEQSDKLLDLRMQCLNRRLQEARALLEVFASRPDEEVLERAVQASMGLIDLGRCSDEAALLADVPTPESPEVRRQVEAVRKLLGGAKALQDTGKYQDGLKLAQQALAAAERTGHKPAEGEALLQVGNLLQKLGRYPDSERYLRRAALVADAAGHDRVRALAWVGLIWVVGCQQANFAEAEKMIEMAEMVVARIHDKGEIRAIWLHNTGALFDAQNDYERALRNKQSALDIRERVFGAEHPDVAASYNNIGNVYSRKGDYDRALEHYEKALRIKERVLGADHPVVAISHNNLGNLLFFQKGDCDSALRHLEIALAMKERALGPDHPSVAVTRTNLGLMFYQVGDYDRALEHHQRALAIRQKALGLAHPSLAGPYQNIGKVFYQKGDLDTALADFRRALAILEMSLGSDHSFLVESLSGQGLVELQKSHYDRAKTLFERVLSICGTDKCMGSEREALALARFGLAKVLWKDPKAKVARFLGGERVRALDLTREALTFLMARRSVPGNKVLGEIELWLRERGISIEQLQPARGQ